jgi:hypothetical protein
MLHVLSESRTEQDIPKRSGFVNMPSTQTFVSYPPDSGSNTRSELKWVLRMASSGMLRRVALVRTDVSKELSSSIIRVTRIGELGTTLAVTS